MVLNPFDGLVFRIGVGLPTVMHVLFRVLFGVMANFGELSLCVGFLMGGWSRILETMILVVCLYQNTMKESD